MISVTAINQLLEREIDECLLDWSTFLVACSHSKDCVCVCVCVRCVRGHLCGRLCIALSIVFLHSLTQDSGIDYRGMSQHAPGPTHIKTHSLCLCLYEGNNGRLLFPRVKRTFRPQLHSKLWHHDNCLNTSNVL